MPPLVRFTLEVSINAYHVRESASIAMSQCCHQRLKQTSLLTGPLRHMMRERSSGYRITLQ